MLDVTGGSGSAVIREIYQNIFVCVLMCVFLEREEKGEKRTHHPFPAETIKLHPPPPGQI